MKRSRKKKGRRRTPRAKRRVKPTVRYAKNPGVSSLLLVNPAERLRAAVKPIVKEAVETEIKKTMPKRPAKPVPARPQAPKASAPPSAPKPKPRPQKRRRRSSGGGGRSGADTAELIKMLKERYPAFKGRKRPYRGKNTNRGLKTLERDRKSILWNLNRGTPAARDWVLKNVPRMNPGSVASIGVGIGGFLATRILSNVASKIPLLNRVGPHLPVLLSAGLTGLAWWLTKTRPDYRQPLLLGTGLATVDQVLRNYVPAYLPSAAGVLGGVEPSWSAPQLSAYEEPMRYLPPYDPLSGLGCPPVGDAAYDDGTAGFDVGEAAAGYDGYDVRESFADSGDGLEGFVAQEAPAGFDGYVADQLRDVPEDAMGDAPGGMYVPALQGAEDYPVEGLGATHRERMQDAAAFMFGGPAALAKLRLMRSRNRRRAAQRTAMRSGLTMPGEAPPGADMRPVVNVYCPPYRRRSHYAQPASAEQRALVRVPAREVPPSTAAPAPTVTVAPTKPVSGLDGAPGGIFGNE